MTCTLNAYVSVLLILGHGGGGQEGGRKWVGSTHGQGGGKGGGFPPPDGLPLFNNVRTLIYCIPPPGTSKKTVTRPRVVGRRGDSHFCSRAGNLVLQEGGRSGGHNRKSHYKEPPKDIFLGKKIFCFKKNNILRQIFIFKTIFVDFFSISWKKILGVSKGGSIKGLAGGGFIYTKRILKTKQKNHKIDIRSNDKLKK